MHSGQKSTWLSNTQVEKKKKRKKKKTKKKKISVVIFKKLYSLEESLYLWSLCKDG
jgi:hypothetical protein